MGLMIAVALQRGGTEIYINDADSYHSEVLRSLVGKLVNGVNATITLTEVTNWTNNCSKQSFGPNIYEMGNDLFLFEFAFRTIAEQVVVGD